MVTRQWVFGDGHWSNRVRFYKQLKLRWPFALNSRPLLRLRSMRCLDSGPDLELQRGEQWLARAHQALHLDAVAAHLLDEVGDHRGGGGDFDLGTGRPGSAGCELCQRGGADDKRQGQATERRKETPAWPVAFQRSFESFYVHAANVPRMTFRVKKQS